MSADGEINVSITSDGEQATLSAPPGLSPEMVSPQALTLIVQQAEVLIDQSVERNIAEFSASYGDGDCEHTAVIATATPPVPGDDARIEWSEGFDPSPQASTDDAGEPSSDDQDKARDHYEGQNYVVVKAGGVIGVVHPATDGTDGTDVRCRVIKPRPGKPIAIKFHSSVSADAQGQITAQIDGVLVLARGELSVSQMLDVSGDVDFSTGHIDFDGSVTVAGAVRPGFTVKASKDIRIGKLIEGADISCAGDMVARSGMVGQGRGTIAIGGNAQFPYLDSVKGTVKGNLVVEREIIDCRLTIGKDLKCPNGAILGGEVEVTGSLVVKVLGSEGWTPTTVALGDVPMLRENRTVIAKAAEALKPKLEKFAEEKRLMEMNPRPSPSEKERLTEISFEASELETKLRACTAKLSEIDAAVKSRRKLDVHITKTIHPKVKLRVGDATVLFKEAVTGPVWICWDAKGQLVYRTSSGTVRPLAEIARVTHGHSTRSGDGPPTKAAA